MFAVCDADNVEWFGQLLIQIPDFVLFVLVLTFYWFFFFIIILVCFAFGLCEAAGLRKLLHSLHDGREETWHATMMGVDLFASLTMGIWFDRFWRHLEVVMFVVSMLSRLIWYGCVIVVWQSKHSRDGFSSKTSYVCLSIDIHRQNAFYFIDALVIWYFDVFVWGVCVCISTSSCLFMEIQFDSGNVLMLRVVEGGTFFWYYTIICIVPTIGNFNEMFGRYFDGIAKWSHFKTKHERRSLRGIVWWIRCTNEVCDSKVTITKNIQKIINMVFTIYRMKKKGLTKSRSWPLC